MNVINLVKTPNLRKLFKEPSGPQRYGNIVLIDRRTRWGNPFLRGLDGTREEVIELYRRDLWRRIQNNEIKIEELASLDGMQLACWCHPLHCHGHILTKAAAWAATQLKEKA